jgi:hypothetical protein
MMTLAFISKGASSMLAGTLESYRLRIAQHLGWIALAIGALFLCLPQLVKKDLLALCGSQPGFVQLPLLQTVHQELAEIAVEFF